MKKFAKLSLVAALAIAGTTASAANLADAIQNVDISGQFRFRVEEKNDGAMLDTSKTDVEVEITAKVPVNDNVTAVFKIDHGIDQADGVNTKGAVGIEDYYFQYVNGATTVLAGQQNIPGRLTDGAQGDGVVALYNMGDFTVGAAAFMDNNLDTYNAERVLSVIGMGTVGPVSLLAQYADLANTGDAINVKADATIEGIKLGVEYTETELDGSSNEYETFKAYVSGSFDIVSATLSYASTGDTGSGSLESVTNAAYGDSAEAASEFLLWQLGSAKKAELSVVAIDATVTLTDAISVRAAYADGEYNAAGNDISEALGQINYKMSSNLNTYLRYSVLDDSTTTDDSERARIEVKYSF